MVHLSRTADSDHIANTAYGRRAFAIGSIIADTSLTLADPECDEMEACLARAFDAGVAAASPMAAVA